MKNYKVDKLQVKIMENGKQVYVCPPVSEIKAYCKEQIENLWDEVKRFEKPHNYYVDLSQELWDLRHKLLHEKSNTGDVK